LKREPNAPTPIDCLLTTWGVWGPCSPCSKERYRSRSILRFGQFGGKPCIVALSDKQPCETRTPCPDKRGHCGKQEFECENGYCIKGRLVCNTEDDCGDFSDEDNCDETKRPPCGDRDIDPSRDIEESDILTANMNVLGMKPAQKALFNEFYNGICDRVRDGNTATYYRKPWNKLGLITYTKETNRNDFKREKHPTPFTSSAGAKIWFTNVSSELSPSRVLPQTRGDKKFTSEFYSDQGKTMEKIINTKSHSLDVSFSLQLKPPLFPVSGGFETGVNFAKSSSLSDFLEKTKGKRYMYLHVKSNIQLGTFQLRKRNLRLSETFLEDLNMLPSTYEKGEYFTFLEIYGTHYSQRGTIGGKYELIYVLDNQTMTSQRSENEKKSIIQDVVSLIQGGTTATLTKLNEMLSSNVNSVDVEQYVEWAATLPQAPAMAPISELIPLNIPDSRIKKVNLERAVEDYVAEYSVCKCKPCLHGGTAILIEGKCECACTLFYKGEACEIPASYVVPADTAIHGSWSCWSNWSTCQQGQRQRTRKCNNPTPGYRGRSCPGANLEPGYC
ncbi:Complement component C6, partial [Ophiophagus hannah]